MKKIILCLLCITPQLFSSDACASFRGFFKANGTDAVPKLALRLMRNRLVEINTQITRDEDLANYYADMRKNIKPITISSEQQAVLDHLDKLPTLYHAYFEEVKNSEQLPNNFPYLGLYIPNEWNTYGIATTYRESKVTPAEPTQIEDCRFQLIAEVAQNYGVQLGLIFNRSLYHHGAHAHSCADSFKKLEVASLRGSYWYQWHKIHSEQQQKISQTHDDYKRKLKDLDKRITERYAINKCLLQLIKEFPTD